MPSAARKARSVEEEEHGKAVSRLNLVYPVETRRRLEELQKATKAATLTETVANAIRVYEWFVEQKTQGREILVQDGGSDPKVVAFLL